MTIRRSLHCTGIATQLVPVCALAAFRRSRAVAVLLPRAVRAAPRQAAQAVRVRRASRSPSPRGYAGSVPIKPVMQIEPSRPCAGIAPQAVPACAATAFRWMRAVAAAIRSSGRRETAGVRVLSARKCALSVPIKPVMQIGRSRRSTGIAPQPVPACVAALLHPMRAGSAPNTWRFRTLTAWSRSATCVHSGFGPAALAIRMASHSLAARP